MDGTAPARTVDQEHTILDIVSNPATLHAVCQRAYVVLRDNPADESGPLSRVKNSKERQLEKLCSTFHDNRMILLPSGGSMSFHKSSEVAWADTILGSSSEDNIDELIMQLSHVPNLATVFPSLRDFFISTVRVLVVGDTWLLPVPQCIALLLSLQRSNHLTRKLCKKVCRRVLEMVASQPAPTAGEAREEYTRSIESLRGDGGDASSTGVCPHGVKPPLRCNEPACAAMGVMRDIAAQMNTNEEVHAYVCVYDITCTCPPPPV